MNYLDLFSGIGGFHKGLIQAGIGLDYVGFSEIDKSAKSIYKYHFKNSEDLGDVNGVLSRDLPKIDIVTFGFPCQDLSLAGKRKGIRASKSGLFFEAMRIVRFTRPKYFIFENVKGLFSSNGGQDFITVLEEIAESGYDGQWQLLNTRLLLPQNRERIYFIGYPREASRPEVFPITERDIASYQNRTFQTGDISTVKLNKKQVSPTLHTGYGQQRGGLFVSKSKIVKVAKKANLDYSKGKYSMTNNIYSKSSICPTLNTMEGGGTIPFVDIDNLEIVRKLIPIECERLQGFDDFWTKFGINENDEIVEISDSQRYKVLGNAVTVDIVELIMRKLKKYL